MTDVWLIMPGQHQGRIQPTAVTPSDGEWVFVLGSQVEGIFADFSDGDYAEITQDVDCTDLHFVRISQLVIREPGDAEVAGSRWEISTRIDGAPDLAFRGRAGRTHVFTDVGIDVSQLTGSHELGIRLELVPE